MGDMTYVALKKLKVGDGYRYKGDEVPEAKDWNNLQAYIAQGAIAVVASGDEAVARSANQVRQNDPKLGKQTPAPAEATDDPSDIDVSGFHEGGGYYELPDGERVRGKDNARLVLAGRSDEVPDSAFVTEDDTDEE